jgi:hypothetical protein
MPFLSTRLRRIIPSIEPKIEGEMEKKKDNNTPSAGLIQ